MAVFCPFCSKEIGIQTAECAGCGATFDDDTLTFLGDLSKEVSKGFHGELRKQARVPVSFRVKCSTPDTSLEGDTFDLSLGGAFITTENPLSMGEIITMDMSLPDAGDSFAVLGEVAWVNKEETETFGKKTRIF